MTQFPESEYFLIKILRKFIFIRLFIIIYVIASIIISRIEHPSSIEIIRFYLGNFIFSIFAMWLSVKLYEQNTTTVNKWFERNDFLNSKDEVINKLNRIHNFFFGRCQFVIIASVIVVILRRIVISLLFLQKETGNIVIDTIAIFLIVSLLFTSIGVIYCLYNVSLNGIKVKYLYEISNEYRGLASVANKAIIIVGLYLAFFGSAIVVWAYQYNTKEWSYIINILFLIGIFIVFYSVSAGIRHGIAMSKQAILSEIKHEIGEVLPIYYSLIEFKNRASQSERSLSRLFKVTLILEFLSKSGKDIEGMNEWMFFPKLPLVFISTISSMISIGRVIIDIRNWIIGH